MKSLIAGLVLFAAFGVVNFVGGGGSCIVTVQTCACDRALGGPGFLTHCGGWTCPHFIVTCEEGTKCAWDEGGKTDCEDAGGPYGLCHVHKGECGSWGQCQYSLGAHMVNYQFYHATGAACP